MADDNRKVRVPDLFYLKKVYPDAQSIFSHHARPLREAINTCLVVLDASALLEPYESNSVDLLGQLRQVYQQLIKEQRLVVPGQAAREFAKNRLSKLADIRETIRKTSATGISPPTKSILTDSEGFRNLRQRAKEVNEATSRYRRAADEFLSEIDDWAGRDPLYALYSDIFVSGVLLDPPIDHGQITEDVERRAAHRLPPGFQDAGKSDRGVGDLLIWRTILSIGKDRREDVLFVTQDGKNDWSVRSGNRGVFPRDELMYEFRCESGGRAFYIASLSEFLALRNVDEQVVAAVRRTEETERELLPQHLSESLIPAIVKWLVSQLSGVTSVLEVSRTELHVTYGGGFIAAIAIEALPADAELETAISRVVAAANRLRNWQLPGPLARTLIVVVAPPDGFPLHGIEDTNRLAASVPQHIEMVLGTVKDGRFISNIDFNRSS